jgi:PAS domain S-box-containing protein
MTTASQDPESPPPAKGLSEFAPSVLNGLGVGLIAMNTAGRVGEMNLKARAMFTPGHPGGRTDTFDDFFPTPVLRDAFVSLLDLVPGHRTPTEEVALTIGGRRLWANVWFKSFGTTSRVETIVAVVEDAASTKREFEIIDSISRRLSSILDINRLLPEIVKLIKDSFGFYNVNIGMVEGDYVVLRAGYGGYWGKPDQELKGEVKLRIGEEGVIAKVASTGQPLLIPDASKESSFFYFPPLGESASEVAVPILSKERVIGVLDVQNDRVGGVTLNDMRILSALASQLSVAIENAYLWAEIKRSREQYFDLYDAAPDLYHSINRDGIIIRCNRTEAEALGLPKEEIIGKPFLDFFDPADRKKVWESVFGRDPTGEGSHAVDARMLRGNDQSIEVSLSARVVRDHMSRVVTAHIVAKDITDKKKLEIQMMHAQKMESLGKLASGIAHDINNLLATILGFTSYLKTIVKDKEIISCLDVVEESIERGTEITDRLLSFARVEPGEFKRVDLAVILRDTIRILERSLDKNITLETKIDAGLRSHRCNPGHIQQILMNLCLNAREAMPEGGTLTVGARNFSRDEIRIMVPGIATAEPYVGLFVSDTGVGIQDEQVNAIFEPFFSTKKKDKASGLGLAVTYSLVKKYDGYINVQSELGRGSTFTVILPVRKTTTMVVRPEPSRPVLGSETILVVDDEKTIRKFTNLALIKLGYHVIEACNGQEAVEAVEAQPKAIDLVILDLMMPVMNGQDAFTHIRAIRPGMPFIISTGYTSAAAALLDAGLTTLLPKPYNVAQLTDAVREILDRDPTEE